MLDQSLLVSDTTLPMAGEEPYIEKVDSTRRLEEAAAVGLDDRAAILDDPYIPGLMTPGARARRCRSEERRQVVLKSKVAAERV